ncbi:hypothetical protein BU15DRAFT_78975 [Melanogaster broomeanus]|nr:hypothetical protein BU15DRAFT_78975 [Melanogaster broomeanus]
MSFEAFTLLTLPNATLTSNGTTQSGPLELECISLAVERGKDVHDHDGPSPHELYLIIRLRDLERPVDPSWPITFSANNAGRSYVFVTADGSTATLYAELIQPGGAHFGEASDGMVSHEAPRGRLVLVDEDNGEVVGELDHNLRIHEDPALGARGAENDPVVIEIADGTSQEAFACLIPPEDRDWITQSAYLASHVISGTTKLLLTSHNIRVIILHRSLYTTRQPALLHALVRSSSSHRKAPKRDYRQSKDCFSPRPNDQTDNGEEKSYCPSFFSFLCPGNHFLLPGPLSGPSSGPSYDAPPPYIPGKPSDTLKPPLPPRSISPQPNRNAYTSMDTKPALPPRKDGSVSPRPPASMSTQQSSGPRPPLQMRHRLLLSADLILSTMDSSMKQVVSVGGEALGRAVEHKYGPEAARSVGLLTGTAKNIVAIYIDTKGFGRQAIIKREDMNGLNTALDSKQQELQLVRRKHGDRGPSRSTLAPFKIAARRESRAFSTPSAPRHLLTSPTMATSSTGGKPMGSMEPPAAKIPRYFVPRTTMPITPIPPRASAVLGKFASAGSSAAGTRTTAANLCRGASSSSMESQTKHSGLRISVSSAPSEADEKENVSPPTSLEGEKHPEE